MLDSSYKYEVINSVIFNNKYLQCKIDGSEYKKYLLICYKDNNKIIYKDIQNKKYFKKIEI